MPSQDCPFSTPLIILRLLRKTQNEAASFHEPDSYPRLKEEADWLATVHRRPDERKSHDVQREEERGRMQPCLVLSS